MLYYSTVSPDLKSVLKIVMDSDILKPFRLVGGTSLSLKKRLLGFARAFKLFFLRRNVGFSQDSLSI